MMDISEIRSRINPQYVNTPGTESFERKWLCDQIFALEKQREELMAALESAVSVAKTAHECWDNDQDMKVGKYLIALSGGLPGYDKRTDEIHAAIASVKGGA